MKNLAEGLNIFKKELKGEETNSKEQTAPVSAKVPAGKKSKRKTPEAKAPAKESVKNKTPIRKAVAKKK